MGSQPRILTLFYAWNMLICWGFAHDLQASYQFVYRLNEYENMGTRKLGNKNNVSWGSRG